MEQPGIWVQYHLNCNNSIAKGKQLTTAFQKNPIKGEKVVT